MFNEILQGKCPACTNPYSPAATSPAFLEQLPGHRLLVIYALCPQCQASHTSSSNKKRTKIQNTCFCNVKLSGESAHVWTITSSLAYEAHGGDFYSAWAYGLSIPRTLFDAIDLELINDTVFLGGAVS